MPNPTAKEEQVTSDMIAIGDPVIGISISVESLTAYRSRENLAERMSSINYSSTGFGIVNRANRGLRWDFTEASSLFWGAVVSNQIT